MKNFTFGTRLLTALAVLLTLAAPSYAQTYTLNSTTLSAAVSVNDKTLTITSASAASGSSFGVVSVGQYLFVDQEMMQITAVSSTTLTVQRQRPTAAHASGTQVWIGAGNAFMKAPPPYGACTAGNQGDPWINIQNGDVWRCVSSAWVLTADVTVRNGIPRPAAATALTGSNVLTITGGVGGAQSATTGNGGNGGAPSITGGLGGVAGTSSGTGGAGGAVTFTGGAGAGTVTGGAGGATTMVGGAGAAGSTTAGAGGAAGVTAGAAGTSTASAGTGSIGGVANLTAGAGGVASTGAATGGAGGATNVLAGAGGGTITGGAGGALNLGAGAGANGSTAGGSGGALTAYSGAVGTGGTGTNGAIAIKQGGAAGTNAFSVSTAGATTIASTVGAQNINITPATTGLVSLTNNNVALVLPTVAGALPAAYNCGSTGSGNQTCTVAAAAGTLHAYSGRSTLSSNAATITFPSTFTSSSTFECIANDVTTRANVVQMIPASGTTATITNTTGGSDVISWICVGQ